MNSRNNRSRRSAIRTTTAKLALLLLCAILHCACTPDLTTDALQVREASVPPVVLLGGTRQAEFSLRGFGELPGSGAFALRADTGEQYPLTIRAGSRVSHPVFILAQVPERTTRCALVALNAAGEPVLLRKDAVRIIGSFRILLSFDDGPAICDKPGDGATACSPTWQTLQALAEFRHGPGDSLQGIKAVFFVLSQPDHFLRETYPKAETADGSALLREETRRGHVVGVHWGGAYYGQTILHTRRALLPPYAFSAALDGKGAQNALECDLRECMGRIESVTGKRPRFIRPPLWRYSDDKNPPVEGIVLDTYRRLGLRMILTDARYPDGGYAVISLFLPNAKAMFRRNLHTAFQSGEDTLIISMHDSNTITAKRLPEILRTIGEAFAGEEFGGQRCNPGHYLRFADTTGKVEDILRSKRKFTLFPAYEPDEYKVVPLPISAGERQAAENIGL